MLFGAVMMAGLVSTFTVRISSGVFSLFHAGSGLYVSRGKSKACANEPRLHVDSKTSRVAPSRSVSDVPGQVAALSASATDLPLMFARQEHKPRSSKVKLCGGDVMV